MWDEDSQSKTLGSIMLSGKKPSVYQDRFGEIPKAKKAK